MEEKHRSSIIAFNCKPLDGLYKKLRTEQIVLARREGSIRVSVHLFNDESDIDRLISVLDNFSRGK